MARRTHNAASGLLAQIIAHHIVLRCALVFGTMAGSVFAQDPNPASETETTEPLEDSAEPLENSAASLPASSIVLLGSQFSLTGLVLGQLPISRDPGELIFENAIGEPVEGNIEKVSDKLGEGTFAWRPDESLVKGQYTARLPGEAKALFYLVSGEGTLPEVVHKLDQFKTGLGTPVHCEEYAKGSSNSIIFEGFRVDAVIDVWIKGKLAPQYLFWIQREDGSLEEISGLYHRLVLEQKSKEVCFEVFSQHALDLVPTMIESTCVDSGVLKDIGLFDEPYGDLAAVLGGCTEPPVGLEPAWCQHFEKAISANDCAGFNDSACIAAFNGCGAGDPPKDALRRVEEDEQADSQPSSGHEGTESASSGYPHCSVIRGARTQTAYIPLMGLSLLLFIRRRHPSRPRF